MVLPDNLLYRVRCPAEEGLSDPWAGCSLPPDDAYCAKSRGDEFVEGMVSSHIAKGADNDGVLPQEDARAKAA